MKNKIACCLNCMDGRTQLPSIEWIKKETKADYVDMITEPAMDLALTQKGNVANAIHRKIDIAVAKHGAQDIFIVGHSDCVGYPVEAPEHKKAILSSIQNLKSLYPNLNITGLWIDVLSPHPKIEKITR